MVRARLLLSELGRLLITDDLSSPRVAPEPNERQISDPRSAVAVAQSREEQRGGAELSGRWCQAPGDRAVRA